MFLRKPHTPPSRSGPTSSPGARPGSTGSLTSTLSAWSSSTRLALRPRWPGCEGVRRAATLSGQRAARTLEDHDLRRRAAPRRHDRALGARWPDERRGVPGLCAGGARADPAARRHRRDGQFACPQSRRRPHRDRGRGARRRLLPPYSPDLNPIENAFAKLKAILRRAAARTIPTLLDAIRDALPTFHPSECANYFTATGYEPE